MSDYGLRVLGTDECRAALATGTIGRVAFCRAHPMVLPVVYGMLDDDVVFRTAPGEKLIAAVLHQTVAFEIDDYDTRTSTGWSVNVVGSPEEIVHPVDVGRAQALGLPCWAGEARDRFVRIRVHELSGRSIEPRA
jgi:nitroimidazol reductase NimA-like FMN-containing flavoprotein (pyridoxamine 5'-phosphate oxidase superfamily)